MDETRQQKLNRRRLEAFERRPFDRDSPAWQRHDDMVDAAEERAIMAARGNRGR